jgi:hypothetical protein
LAGNDNSRRVAALFRAGAKTACISLLKQAAGAQ